MIVRFMSSSNGIVLFDLRFDAPPQVGDIIQRCDENYRAVSQRWIVRQRNWQFAQELEAPSLVVVLDPI